MSFSISVTILSMILLHLPKGYHEAGKRLAGMLAARGYRDFGLSILFLYRHVELFYMKAITYIAEPNSFTCSTPELLTSKLFRVHRLSLLLPV